MNGTGLDSTDSGDDERMDTSQEDARKLSEGERRIPAAERSWRTCSAHRKIRFKHRAGPADRVGAPGDPSQGTCCCPRRGARIYTVRGGSPGASLTNSSRG